VVAVGGIEPPTRGL